ncbi:putative disease resistance protein (TIR-NBS-LRR class) [Melia azedarach]|uniref:Disease resistance protein (TIR-NBS-LRR class) n=1 Tax=Melia azedarach TaxID=155640 RepID=A0ACC1YMG6_MELAZ|nr:putative disease resistance protein (TIR-NBS-LRR class) [Melia azedarach]
MASSSSIPQTKYDVFLSFRGEDTRKTFTSHLHYALREKKIQTFIDDQLIGGDEISPSLLNAIERSNISVIIFSERYASSGWCLDELIKILECQKMYGQIVIPIFYRVDPSDVRNQTGVFGELFSKLEERFRERLDKLQSWKIALKDVAGITGFDSRVIRTESELIEKITNNILRRLEDNFESYDEEHLIGVESHIKEIESQLRMGSIGVYTLGIWGMGGIGKTKIAHAIFKRRRSHFDGSCFIENVREREDKNGLVHLRQQLFSALLQDENVKIDVSDISLNLQRLQRKKVFIVFDDVTHWRQIDSLIGYPYYVGEGSRIIITTRDRQVLKNCEVNEYEIKQLSQTDALELFSQCAFKQNHPNLGYKELSIEIIEYTQGIPLALKVLGYFLLGREKEEWRSAIKKLKRVPHKDIQEVLKISYDGLDDEEQNIFLDIACFFNWKDKDYIITFLEGCDFSAKIGIQVLIDKCLIVESYNKIIMHDLLQEMGREIVRQESVDDPGKRSRLWYHDDIYKVLTNNMGTEAIQTISFNMATVKKICLNPCSFRKIWKLRFLEFYGENKCKLSQFRGSRFSEVRYFCWDGYPVKSFPLHKHCNSLISLELRDSSIEELWDGTKDLDKLKHIDLSNSKQLLKLPDLSKAPNLEKLILKGCSSLVETHSSIQHLSKLVIMDLRNCESLKSLPPTIHTESLEKLLLSDCKNLKRLPEISSIGGLSRLVILDLRNCESLESLPSSISVESIERVFFSGCKNLKRFPEIPSIEYPSRLVHLDLGNCSMLEHLPRSIGRLKSLQSFCLSDCPNLHRLPDELGHLVALKRLEIERTSIREVPETLGQLSSLERLYLEKNNFERVPESIIKLSNLGELSLSCCERLRYLPELPRSVFYVDASHCTSLEAISIPTSLKECCEFSLRNCFKLNQNQVRKIVKYVLKVTQVTARCKESNQVHRPGWGQIYYPGNEIPEWFEFRSTGSSIILELPHGWFNNKYIDIAFCAVVAFEEDHNCGDDFFELWSEMKVKTKDCQWHEISDTRTNSWVIDYTRSDHVFLGYGLHTGPFTKFHDKNEVLIQFHIDDIEGKDSAGVVKKCGAHLVYVPDLGKSMKDRSRSFSSTDEENPHPKRLKI